MKTSKLLYALALSAQFMLTSHIPNADYQIGLDDIPSEMRKARNRANMAQVAIMRPMNEFAMRDRRRMPRAKRIVPGRSNEVHHK